MGDRRCHTRPVTGRVRSDLRHRFAVSPDDLWDRLAAVDEFRTWWPWLRHLHADGLRAGAVWSCVVQPPLPYRLRFDLTLDEVVAGQAVWATVHGDIVGTAHLEVRQRPGGSELHLISDLAPRRRVLKAASSVARPLAQFGHDWVLDTGIQQFRDRALGEA